MLRFFKFLAIASLLALGTIPCWAESPRAQITFDNKTGQLALVKLVGPTRRSAQVPTGQTRTVTATGGHYYILTRLGADADHYSYSKGDPFTVIQNYRQYSIITITLHPVVNGNYHTNPSTASEFDQERTD